MASVLALVFLTLFAALAVAFATSAHMGLHTTRNYKDAVVAEMAAESGLAYAMHALSDCESEPTLQELPDMLDVIQAHLAAKIPGSAVCQTQMTLDGNSTVRCVTVSPQTLPSGDTFTIKVYVCDVDANQTPTKLQMVVTGQAGGLTRRVGIRFDVDVDKTLLHYSVSSTSRIIARGNVRMHGPISTSYGRFPEEGVRNNSIYPLDIRLGWEGRIDGTIGTTDSKADFTGDPSLGDDDFHDGISSENPSMNLLAKMVYNQPHAMDLDVDDFDTSPLKARTSTANLPPADYDGRKWYGWGDDGSGKPPLENICVPKGTNPHFKKCRFKGITYIDVNEETTDPTPSNQNKVIFEDCTFEGPIITGVPRKMNWKHNKMEFRGKTVFRTSMIQETLGGVTLMAPNYNVNIGGCENGGGEGNSDVCGLIVGGCVDLYNDITVRGTVVSMAKLINDGQPIMNMPLSWLASSGVCGANVGNLDGSSQNIDIWPDPSNVIPLGIKKRYRVFRVKDSYEEYPN